MAMAILLSALTARILSAPAAFSFCPSVPDVVSATSGADAVAILQHRALCARAAASHTVCGAARVTRRVRR